MNFSRFFAQYNNSNQKIGKIYMITSENTEAVYVGSTTQDHLFLRLFQHWVAYHKYTSGKTQKYCASFDVSKAEAFSIKLLEIVDDISLLLTREKHFIQSIDNCCNRNNKIIKK
jgi:hypothetical protein